jgi:uncharacterized protein (TIGR00730 family)
MNKQNIAVFCGSKFGNNSNYTNQTIKLGQILGKHKKHLIYGGGDAGLMGAIAQSTLANGGTVTGIIPEFLHTIERKKEDLTNLIVTKTMHQRKQLLFEKSDAAIILPGGYGTLDELFELLTWNQLELHKIIVFILNVDGFYDALLQHIENMRIANFLYITDPIIVLSDATEIQAYL